MTCNFTPPQSYQKRTVVSKLSSDTITALRFPLMVGIVFIHFGVSEGIPYQGEVYGANPPYWLICVNNLFSQVVARIGVPLFFLISGYLFFLSGLDRHSYKRKLQKRARTLLLPYVLWNAVFVGREALRSFLPGAPGGNWSFPTILGCFWNIREGVFYHADPTADAAPFNLYPQCVPMWFVRELMLMVLLAPLIYHVVKKMGWYAVAVFGITWFFVYSTTGYFTRQFSVALLFFSWGACLALKGKDLVTWMSRFPLAPCLYVPVAIADTLTKGQDYNFFLHHAGIIVGVFAAVNMVSKLLEYGKIRASDHFLADSSFFLFALHTLFMHYLAVKIVSLYVVDSPYYMLALYFIVPCATIAICLALYWLLRRFTPSFAALLTGRR